jgi:hypothetical protein
MMVKLNQLFLIGEASSCKFMFGHDSVFSQRIYVFVHYGSHNTD